MVTHTTSDVSHPSPFSIKRKELLTRVAHSNVVVVSHDDIREIAKHFTPNWESVPLENINVSILSGGITNILYKCKKQGGLDQENNVSLVRIFGSGTELFLNRDREISMIQELQQVGLASRCFGRFKNGMVYSFRPGRPLNHLEMTTKKFMTLVAPELRRWHNFHLESISPETNSIMSSIHRWLPLVGTASDFHDENKRQRFLELPISQLPHEIALLESLIQELYHGQKKYVCCHNDLLCGNIIWNEALGTVKFIDYEYCGYTYAAYDLANYFNEATGDKFDWNIFPSKESQYFFIRHYLQTDDLREIHQFYKEVCLNALISNIFWAIWGLMQAQHSTIDFDFMEYTSSRFKGYYLFKDDFLSIIRE